MNNLKIDNKYLDLILRGKKKTTIRLGRRSISENEDLFLTDDDGRQVSVRVTETSTKRLIELDDSDAMADGFENRDHLLQDLLEIYPDSSSDDIFTIIAFVLMK